jgi:hypothetical protein
MTRPLAMVLLLLLAAATWRTGFHMPPSVSAQEPFDDPLALPRVQMNPPRPIPSRLARHNNRAAVLRRAHSRGSQERLYRSGDAPIARLSNLS